MTDRILRKPELRLKVGMCDSTIYRAEKAGRFPQRIQLGANSVGWLESEVDKWIEKKAQARGE